MAVVIIKKECPPYEYKNKKEAIQAIKAAGDDVENYEFRYVYREIRSRYGRRYDDLHRNASLRYYHRNKMLKKQGNKNADSEKRK